MSDTSLAVGWGSLLAVVGLPMLLVYMLLLVRHVERRTGRALGGPKRELMSLFARISLRDAALVVLTLDFAELIEVFWFPGLGALDFPVAYQAGLLGVLFLLHVFALLAGLHIEARLAAAEFAKYNVRLTYMNLYMALSVLVTNPVTIQHLLRMVGAFR